MDKTRLLELTNLFLDKKDIFNKLELTLLEDILKEHSKLYYEQESPIISDKDYDILFDKLKKNKKELFVGDNISSTFQKVAHSRPMISLDNTYNSIDLIDFDDRIKKIVGNNNYSYVSEFKFDGLGLELIYDNGKFIQAITRGDGVYGEDVTQNVMQIQNIPKNISYTKKLEIRGEVIMPISVFERINKDALKKGEKVFSNPRNAASGSLRLIDNSITKSRELQFFAYDLGFFDETFLYGIENYFDMIKKIDSLGFMTSSYFKKFDNILDFIGEIELNDIQKDKLDFLKDKNIDFDIDGIVIKVNNMNLWNNIGFTQHHPRYAIAYKFPADIYVTKVLSIEHSIGRTGTITPVANLEDVNIGGAIIKRATLHNYDELEKLGLMIGDRVFIKRAGEVIPDIISVIKETRNGTEKQINIPSNCPSCNSIIKKDEDKVRYYCPNHNGCSSQIIGKLIYQVGKSCLNIDGLGEKQVELFYKKGFIKQLPDIFFLKNYKEEILKLDGYKDKSVNNLMDAIEKSKKVNISIFINSLAISGVGKKTSKIISHLFISKNDIYNFKLNEEDFLNIDGIGEEISKNIVNYFRENKDFIKNYLDIIDIEFDNNISKENLIFNGKKICITGSFNNYSRDDLVEILNKNGGEFVNTVSKKTSFLLAGENAGSKLIKAKELGIEIIGIEEFLDIIK